MRIHVYLYTLLICFFCSTALSSSQSSCDDVEIVVLEIIDCDDVTATALVTYSISGGQEPYMVFGSFSATLFENEPFTLESEDNATTELLITDANGCTLEYLGETISCTKDQLCDYGISESFLCDETNMPKITFALSGGASPYFVTGDYEGWLEEGEEATVELENNSGIRISIVDAGGCTAEYQGSVIACSGGGGEPPEPECEEIAVEESIDCDTTTGEGSIALVLTGGTPPYTLSGDLEGELKAEEEIVWTEEEEGDILNLLITDANGCEQTYESEAVECEMDEPEPGDDGGEPNPEPTPEPSPDAEPVSVEDLGNNARPAIGTSVQLSVFDNMGRLLHEGDFVVEKETDLHRLSLPNLSKGVYIIHLNWAQERYTYKTFVH